uniref:Uncharacterized protein n=1 Tax=Brassica oleracea TaxID=3712 RepID=A0A3P6H0K7_BRAOL|nr:unnamed protein product [Brassica oleracea]
MFSAATCKQSDHTWEKDLCAKFGSVPLSKVVEEDRFKTGTWVARKKTTISKQKPGFKRRIMTTAATTTKRLGIGTVRINNEEKLEKARSCAMWRRSGGELSIWKWRGRSKCGFQQFEWLSD